ncbi:hypothetical protein GCM10010909_27590 [Acidocella aquatica]|uniref:Uncharacterized protein n=1 Tax=Acidocella aquatica TaxID=1922313 RepID=A0ABQ6A8Z7_9PROT|nr:hypothetical protein [Acidocella aquatica]GLR68078.1 hypothetical protein GCM10010909_27590 [Acidocella aquatica]
MKMYSKDGIEMMDVKSISLDGDNLVVKGKMMGTMATTIILKPKDAWEALHLFSWSTIFTMPGILFKGMLAARKTKAPA